MEHSRTHPKGMPMPSEPVGIDPAVLSALADLLSTVENLGKRVKALEPRTQRTAETLASERVLTDARLAAHLSHLNRVDEQGSRLAAELASIRASIDAVGSRVTELASRHESVLASVATQRSEFKQTRADAAQAANLAADAKQASLQADAQFAQFAKLRKDLDKLMAQVSHEREERVTATRKFQRSLRDVRDTIAES